jgi:D-amino-acid dehydrogenase
LKPSTNPDVIVLGAGIVGITLALQLGLRGRRVTLIDRSPPGAATSFGNAGLIERSSVFPYAFPREWRTLLAYARQRKAAAHYHWQALPSLFPWLIRYWKHSSPQHYPAAIAGALPLVEHSWSEHEPLIEAAGARKLVNEHGWIKLYRTHESEAASRLMAQQSLDYGLRVTALSIDELRALEPGVGDGVRGGVHYPDSRQISDPHALSLAYLSLFRERGGEFLTGDARSLHRNADAWQVATAQGVVQAPDVVVALGPWGEDFARQLGYRLPMGRKRGYHRHFANTLHPLRHTLVDVDHGYALAPMARGIRLTTGAEFAKRDAPATPVQLGMLEPIARRLYPLGETLDETPWLGSRPCTPDMLPLLGPAPRHTGLWFSFGHAHHGLTQAASSGRLMAEMICGLSTYTDPTPYRVDRF